MHDNVPVDGGSRRDLLRQWHIRSQLLRSDRSGEGQYSKRRVSPSLHLPRHNWLDWKGIRMRVARRILGVPTYAPAGAVVVVVDRRGTSIRGELRHGDRLLAQVAWNADGKLVWEKRMDSRGRAHGLEREFDDGGRAVWQVPWRHGLVHGTSRMFASDGRCIAESKFVDGVGVDLFLDESGACEYREMAAGLRHGFERWAKSSGLVREGHYKHGARNGVFREWLNGVLEGGYPKYFVDDVEVSGGAYRNRRKRSQELPTDQRADDSAIRQSLVLHCVPDALVVRKTIRLRLGRTHW